MFPVKGDYVLATKYADGDPQDQWCVGFYDGVIANGRHFIVDGEGRQFRANGFRRCQKIDQEHGRWFLDNAKAIELSGRGIWSHLRMLKNRDRFGS